MMETPTSKYWLDLATAEIIKHFPEGEIILSSGISPSASYHVGHFREIMTTDALTWALKKAGREAKHVHVVDNFDPLRKRYDFLPERFEEFVGQPICLIPDPIGDCHPTYAEHFYQEFAKYAEQMGIVPDQVLRGYEDLYKPGRLAGRIEQAVAGVNKIRRIFKEVSNRDLPADWMPLQLLGPKGGFNELKFESIDKTNKTVTGVSEDGQKHQLHYDQGQVKLVWRLDWPARWAELGVMVEPFGAQEHGAAGGSYETGAHFCREIFGAEPPLPVAKYANIHLVGDTTKMSSSKGNLITPEQALEIMPPEVLRYFVVRSRPDRTLYFDPGVGLFNLIDEFSAVQEAVRKSQPSEFKEAYEFATNGIHERVISALRFNHLVTVYQTANGNAAAAIKILQGQSDYEFIDWDKETPVLDREFKFVQNWLAKYAPKELKFTVQPKLPEVDLNDQQKKFLADLADKLEAADAVDAQSMHELIYAAKGDIQPAEAFQALYRIILGRDKGPRAGWFLASLDKAWLIQRLRLEN